MIWDVKICLAKIKDGKGKEFKLLDQEIFAHKNLAKIPRTGYFRDPEDTLVYSKLLAMKWKDFVRDYLCFSRRDRIAIFTMIVIILVLLFIPALVNDHNTISVKTKQEWIAAAKELQKAETDSSRTQMNKYPFHNSAVNSGRYDNSYSLFYFDPNTITAGDWKKLGLRDKTIQTIKNYISKGGRFKKATDLQRIYGLFPDEFERLAPYVRIKTSEEITDSSRSGNPKEWNKKNDAPLQLVDINSSDTSLWIALPGIGNKLAARIINFRDKLGGFYSIDQVKETYGVPDSTFQKIRPSLTLKNISLRKININIATAEELKAHPYIRWSLANPIISYRNEHGAFKKLEELKNIMVITDEVFNKISPYLALIP